MYFFMWVETQPALQSRVASIRVPACRAFIETLLPFQVRRTLELSCEAPRRLASSASTPCSAAPRSPRVALRFVQHGVGKLRHSSTRLSGRQVYQDLAQRRAVSDLLLDVQSEA